MIIMRHGLAPRLGAAQCRAKHGGASKDSLRPRTRPPHEHAAPNPKCDRCEGTNKNAPVVGLVILSGLTKVGDEYVGGQILDPDNGKVYRSKVRLTDNGKKLSVRGYIGVPMLGRSQTWVRQE